jgi:hypothetical protein
MGQSAPRAFAPQSRSQRPEKSLSGPRAPAAAATSEVEEQRERGWGPASIYTTDGPQRLLCPLAA